MADLLLMLPPCFLVLQPQPLPITTNALKALIITALFLAFVIAATIALFRYFRSERESSAAAKVRAEFEKGKEALLASAMAKKQASQAAEGEVREVSAEDQEREALRESVDPTLVIGQDCRLCGLEMAADEDLALDPYTGTGYHLSCFLNAWPVNPDDHKPLPRPKFIYRYPEATVLKSSELVRTF